MSHSPSLKLVDRNPSNRLITRSPSLNKMTQKDSQTQKSPIKRSPIKTKSINIQQLIRLISDIMNQKKRYNTKAQEKG